MLEPRPRVPGPWMPVRSNSRRLGGSLYRWLVVHLLPRRRHTEATASSKHEHRHGGSAPPGKGDALHGKALPRPPQNGRSSSPCGGARRKEAREGGGWAGGVGQHVFTTRGSGEMLTTDSSALPAIQTVDASLSAASCALCRRDAAGVARSRVQLVQEAPAGCRLDSPAGRGGAAASPGAGRARREEASAAQGASGGRTCTRPGSPPAAARPCERDPAKGGRGAFPLLNVRGLEQSSQGSVQSLAAPRTCKHISVVRQWDSISVLYGVEYLEVRKKVHERLLCILRSRREKRQRREAVEGAGGVGARPRRHSHRRKRRKRKVKGKHGGKKDGKPPRATGGEAEVEGGTAAVAAAAAAGTQERGVQASLAGSDALRAAETYNKECRELGDLDDVDPACLHDEGATERVAAAAMPGEEEGEGGSKSKEVFEFMKDEMLAFVRSPSGGSGDSRPSKSLSYHKVTSSEKSSSHTSSFMGTTRVTPQARDLSAGRRAPCPSPHAVPSPASSSASSSTSSSSTASSASSLSVTSPSVKSTGGLSASIKTVAYVSDDESASERRRSALYCCPCFISLRRRAKKSRRR